MSRIALLNELVTRFARRPPPPSGVISRSRMRSWYQQHGGNDKDWGAFVAKLVQLDLWSPWLGADAPVLETAAEEPKQRHGYREAPKQTPPPTLEAEVRAKQPRHLVARSLLCFAVGCFFISKWVAGAVLAGVAALVALTQLLHRRKNMEVRRSGHMLRIFSGGQLQHEIASSDVDWVDVFLEDQREIEPGVRNPHQMLTFGQARHRVLLRRHDGMLLRLGSVLTSDDAIAFCRAVEAAMLEAKQLEAANHAKVRVAKAKSHVAADEILEREQATEA